MNRKRLVACTLVHKLSHKSGTPPPPIPYSPLTFGSEISFSVLYAAIFLTPILFATCVVFLNLIIA